MCITNTCMRICCLYLRARAYQCAANVHSSTPGPSYLLLPRFPSDVITLFPRASLLRVPICIPRLVLTQGALLLPAHTPSPTPVHPLSFSLQIVAQPSGPGSDVARLPFPGEVLLWPGKDYCNEAFCVTKGTDLPFLDHMDRGSEPRLPWHDFAVKVRFECGC